MTGEKCSNCGTIIELNFCPNCGQKKYKRIDRKYIKDELQYTLLHTNKGFFYTLKKLLQNPGNTTKEFLDGNRVNHYKPILLVFVLTGLSTFLSFKVIHMGETMTEFFNQSYPDIEGKSRVVNSLGIIYNYTTLLIMSFIPFLALSSLLSFRKQGHNYYEHVVIICFFYVLFTVATIVVVYPILYFIKDPKLYMIITSAATFLGFPLLIWFFKGLYPNLTWGKIIQNSIVFSIITFIIYLFVSTGSGIVATLISLAFKG